VDKPKTPMVIDVDLSLECHRMARALVKETKGRIDYIRAFDLTRPLVSRPGFTTRGGYTRRSPPPAPAMAPPAKTTTPVAPPPAPAPPPEPPSLMSLTASAMAENPNLSFSDAQIQAALALKGAT
jgi:hypothetical protein